VVGWDCELIMQLIKQRMIVDIFFEGTWGFVQLNFNELMFRLSVVACLPAKAGAAIEFIII